MKFVNHRGDDQNILWGDHAPGCKSCREVVMEKPATFAQACVMGSQLLKEFLAIKAAPEARERAATVEQWARDSGGFKMGSASKEYVKSLTRYVGD